MKKILVLLMLSVSCMAYSDDGVNTPYSSDPLESSVGTSKQLFKSGWYGHSKDITYIKLIQVGKNMGLSILFSSTGYFCPIDQYLPFNADSKIANAYNYTVGNGCIATITMNPKNNTFKLTVNSRSKCFEEPTYQEFCNGNLDVHMTDERASTLFVNKVFTYQKKQSDDDYDWNDD